MTLPWISAAPPGVFDSDVVPRLLAASAELILDALPPLQPQMRFLEVGAAGGLVARALVERIAGLGRLVAVDVDEAQAARLPVAARRAARAAAGLPLPFMDGVFDVAVANLTLGGGDDERWLAELRRVMKPRGAVLATALVRGSWDAAFDLLDEAAERAGAVVAGGRLRAARDALPEAGALVEFAERAGLARVAPVGVEDRLVAFAADGAALLADPLVRAVLLPGWWEGAPPPDAVASVAREFFPDGVPLVARTAVLVLQAR